MEDGRRVLRVIDDLADNVLDKVPWLVTVDVTILKRSIWNLCVKRDYISADICETIGELPVTLSVTCVNNKVTVTNTGTSTNLLLCT